MFPVPLSPETLGAVPAAAGQNGPGGGRCLGETSGRGGERRATGLETLAGIFPSYFPSFFHSLLSSLPYSFPFHSFSPSFLPSCFPFYLIFLSLFINYISFPLPLTFPPPLLPFSFPFSLSLSLFLFPSLFTLTLFLFPILLSSQPRRPPRTPLAPPQPLLAVFRSRSLRRVIPPTFPPRLQVCSYLTRGDK